MPVREGVLGLFPGCVAAGGIQASGRIAWEAIRTEPADFGPAWQLCYGDSGPNGQSKSLRTCHTPSRLGALLAAATLRRRFRLIVVWHMDLLRLLPFVRARDAQVVLILQGVEAWRRRAWPERALMRRVDTFLSISDYTWRRFAGAYPEFARARHQTVHLGIGSRWEGATPVPDSIPAALMLGRLARGEDYKGHREMIAAWPLVQRQLPEAQLWIAGDGDLKPELEHFTRERGVDGAVRFLGFVSDADKLRLLQNSRCMAIPSRGEGFGLVYLEAMRVGRPCLVSTLDAGQEVVDPPRHGLAVDPNDRESVAGAACRLLASGDEWQQWSQSARQRYEQHFSATHYQQRLLSTLSECVGV